MSEQPNIKKSTLVSTFSLFFQSGFSAVLGLITNLILSVELSAAIFGTYALVQSAINLLNYFSDIGLAASLVQKDTISDDDIKTTFTLQQILIITAVIIGYFLTPFVMNFYDFPAGAAQLYWALLIGFFISSLKTIPSIFLERKIQFQKIVFVQIVENIVFYSVVSILALAGFGIQSLTIGVLSRAVIGLIVMYSTSFWVPQMGISMASVRTLLSFGLPFQASSFLALFKDDFIYFFLGKVLGLEAIGYISWAKKWAEAPIRIIMDNLSRVLFPLLSRFQQDKEKVSRVLEKIINYQTLLLAPVLTGAALLMPVMVDLIPKYSKWEPAIPIFYIFLIAAFFSSLTSPFMNLFNALGRVKISFTFMVIWTTITWLLTPPLTAMYGWYGFPINQLILSFSCFLVIHQAKKIIQISVLKSVFPAITSAIVMGLALYLYRVNSTPSIFSFVTLMLLGVIVYNVFLLLIFQVNALEEFKKIIKHD